MPSKRKPLTEADWDRVFTLRCQSKRGHELSKEQHDFCMRAYKQDAVRYGKMDARVFNATVPFGSNVRIPEGTE